MHVIGKVVYQQAVCLVLIEAGHFTASCTDTGHSGTYAWTGATKIPTVVVDLVEEVLGTVGIGTDEHDVTGLTVEGYQT